MKRCLAAVGVGVAVVMSVASVASAHTGFIPAAAEGGSTVEVSLSVADERSDAGITKVELFFPEATPVVLVDAPETDGWSVTVDGTVGEAVTSVTWDGGPSTDNVRFPLTLTMPAEPGRLQFKLLQTYDDGTIDRWIADMPLGAEEPDNPGPIIDVAGSGAPVTTADDGHDHDHGDGHEDETPDTATPDPAAQTTTAADDDGGSALPIILGIAAVLVVGGGGFMALRARKSS